MRIDARKLTAVALLALMLLVVPLVVGRTIWSRLRDFQSASLRDAVTDSHTRVRAALDSQFDELCRTLEDWSAWDAMYGFACDPCDAKWREENFSPDSVASLALGRIALFDRSGRLVLKSDYDLAGGQAADFALGPADRDLVAGLCQDTRLELTRGGMCLGPDGRPAWAAVKPIRKSDKSGPIAGFLMMVRPLSQDILDQISAITGATVTLVAPNAVTDTGDDPEHVDGAERYNSSLVLGSWDGQAVGELSVASPVRSLMLRHETLRGLFVRMGIVGYVILSAASLLTFAVVWARSADHAAAGTPTTGRLPVLMAAAAGVGFTIAATWGVIGWQQQTHRAEFARRAGNFGQIFKGEISQRRDALAFCQAYFHSSDVVDKTEFDRLISNAGLWYDGTRQWAWIPESRFKNAAPSTPAGEVLVTPAWAAEPLGALLKEWPGFEAVCEHAQDSGRIVGLLMPENADLSPSPRTVALVAPVYQTAVDSLLEHRRREFRGVLISVVELDKVLEQSGRHMDYGGMVGALATVSSRPVVPEPVDELVDGLLARRCSVTVADGLCADLTINATDRFRFGLGAAVPMTVAAVSLVLTGLLCAFIEVHLQRTRRVEQLVALRTSELQQRTTELLSANAAAEEAHKAKSAFLANMSHELRTPLTAILGYADLLGEAQHAPEAREDFVRTIRRSGEHLLALINDVLDLSKIEAGRMQVERIPSSTTALVEDSVALLRERASRKKIQLALEYVGPVPATISTDPTRFRQVLVNLIGNAVKFTDSGGVRVLVRLASAADDPDPVLTVEVIDTGPGIDAAVMSRLFQPFEQGDGSMSRRFGGTGLGLSISRQLAEMLGGSIHATSVPGEGSSFTFTSRIGSLEGVTLIDPARAGHAAAQPGPTADRAGSQDCTGARILLAEDTLDNQRLLRFHLQRLRADITVVSNGREALDAVRQAIEQSRPYEVVLLDMQMPVMDGYTAVRTLRAVGVTVPVVALTAHSSLADEKRCIEAGCDGFLSKPVEREQLIDACRRYIIKSREASMPRRAAA